MNAVVQVSDESILNQVSRGAVIEDNLCTYVEEPEMKTCDLERSPSDKVLPQRVQKLVMASG